MPLCPRCRHPAPQAPAVCTQCGCDIPAEADPLARSALPRALMVVLLVVLLAVFVILVLVYVGEAGPLGR